MATFAKSTFSAASYAAFRPSYPSSLFKTVLAYHRGPTGLCVDLGCGTGIVTREMGKRFDRSIGTDPSAVMIKQAVQGSTESKNVEYREGGAEDGSAFLKDGEVDCIVAGQAAHWFDYSRLWPEMRRIVRPGGTLAFWGYKDHVFVDFPAATEIMQRFAYDTHPDLLGSYWPQPGRSYVQDKLRIIQPPAEDWEDLSRVEYEPGTKGRHSGEGTPVMEKTVTIGQCKAYVRTWSSFHGWQETHPDAKARNQGGEGDIVDHMFDQIASETEYFANEDNSVDIEWGSGIILARRR
ncbi:Hypothetical protein R9X50_00221200 [Acrodontium crateriforme]|uniref:Methyltransferase type 11 domain-containing protein n=1 Tax=Acrodontium crateriforme TaxID=150365 RepID=A0AAQ3R6G2_9PEZI|nr:Hypothetical protein R9X50_00221200 [Acrodontium crateriforme]